MCPPPPPKLAIAIQDLSDEILDYIFSFLDVAQRIRAELVCKRWLGIASKPTHVTLHSRFYNHRKLDDNVLCRVLSHCGRSLKEIILKPNTRLTCESLSKVGDYCPNLVRLEIHPVGNLQVACLKAIAVCCIHLKVFTVINHVNVPKVDGNSNSGTVQVEYRKTFYSTCNKGLFAVAQCCKTLECLCISDLTHVTLHWLGVINPNLQSLCLRRACLTSDSIQCLIRRCHMIQRLTIDRCEPMDHGLLMEFLKKLKHTLRVFKVTLQGFEDDWRGGLQVLFNLEVLQLYLCDKVDDDLMEVLAKNCSKLRYLDIGDTSVSDVGLASLQGLPCLKEVRIGRMIANSALNITGCGLESLIAKGLLRQVNILPRSPELKSVCHKLAAMHPTVRFVKEPMPCSCVFQQEASKD